MKQAHLVGWSLFAAAVGVILVQLGNEVTKLPSWHAATSPVFIGSALAHVGTVIGAFLGGKMIPTKGEDE